MPRKYKDNYCRPMGLSWDDPTLKALDAFIASQLVPPSRSATVVHIVRAFLAEKGFWPPKDEEKPPEKKS